MYRHQKENCPMNLGEILTKAWKIVWKFKVLWIFGILAGFMEGGANFSSSFNFQESGSRPNIALPPQVQRFFDNLVIHPQQYIGLFAALMAFVCLFWLVALTVGTLGRIGLIKGALRAEDGAESLRFGELWAESLPLFWRVLGLTLASGLIVFVFVVGLIAAAALTAAVTLGIGLLCLIPLICLLVPVFWLLGILVEQATLSMVDEGRGLTEAVQRAWGLFRANWSQYALTALILFGIRLLAGIVIALPIFLIALPVFLSFTVLSAQQTLLWWISGICLVIYLPVGITARGALTAYTQTVWALTFRQLAKPPISIEITPLVPELSDFVG